MTGPRPGDEINNGDGHHGLGAIIFSVGDEVIGVLAGRAAADAFVVVIRCRVVTVGLPVVTGGGIAAPAVCGSIQIAELRRAAKGYTVYIRTDGMLVGGGVHADGDLGGGWQCR